MSMFKYEAVGSNTAENRNLNQTETGLKPNIVAL